MNLLPFPLAVTALDRTALALVTGTAAAWLYLLAPQRRAPGLYSSPLPVLAAALALLALTAGGDLLARTAALADVDPGAAWPYVGRVLTHSDYGLFWQLRLAAWLGLVVLTVVIARRGAGLYRAAGVALGAALTLVAVSSTGHAGDGGALTLPNLMNGLHLAGAGLWGGTVAVYTLRILPRQRAATPAALAQTAERLSTLAGAALALVLATGLYNAWRQVPQWAALWETDYGRVLLVKLALVAVMMAIGAANRFFLVPALAGDRTAPVRRFLCLLRIDVAVFVAVMICAALLGAQTPPAHAAGETAALESIPGSILGSIPGTG